MGHVLKPAVGTLSKHQCPWGVLSGRSTGGRVGRELRVTGEQGVFGDLGSGWAKRRQDGVAGEMGGLWGPAGGDLRGGVAVWVS